MKRLISLIFLLFALFSLKAQLVVNTGAMTPTQYVQNVLLGGGVTVSNVTFSGQSYQIGTFDATNTNPYIGLDNGIIMASGDVNVAVGPNNNTGANIGNPGFGVNDPDLDVLAGVGTNDAAVLEFDFIPTGDTVKFNFVFGSEEYPEFVNSINDAFGFFLSGPGISGPFTNNAQNIALVPGTTTPVTINTVNSGSNPSFYVDNNNQAGSPNAIQFDGYTTVMTAIGLVQCGLQYHIKIAVADASDDILDSGVFLEAGSFSSNTITMNSDIDINNGQDSILYEGCGFATLDFARNLVADTSVYHYTVTGSATGGDYTISADSVVFLPGQDSVTLTFSAIQDGITEPMEEVTIELVQTICNILDTQRVTFYIADFPQPILSTHDTLISCGSNDSVPVWVDITGPPNTLMWNTGATTDTIWVQPTTTTTYYVSVSDTCGVYTVNDSATVTVISATPINLTMSNDVTKYCPQDSAEIFVSVTGGGGGITYDWNPTGSTDSSLFVNPIVTTTYVVTVEDICGTIEQDSVTITVPNFIALTNTVTTNDTVICPGEQVTLNASINGGVGTYFSWNNGLGNALPVNVNPMVTTTYILTAEDSCGAIVKDSITVTINTAALQVTVDDYTMSCLNEQITLTANVNGAIGNESYLWSTGDTTTSIQVNPSITSSYFVTVTNSCNSYSDTAEAIVPIFDAIVLTTNNDTTVNCPNDDIVLMANYTGGSQQPLVYNWSDGTNTFTGNNILVNPELTTTYTVWVNDTCAFDGDTTLFTVTVPVPGPLQITVSPDAMVCVGDTLDIFAVASGGSGGYMYDWGGPTSDTLTIIPYYNSNYNVTVTDACGIQVSGTVTVTVTKPDANFTYEYSSEYTVEFEDSSYSDIIANWWSFDPVNSDLQLNPTHTFLTPGEQEVWLAVEDINGCKDTVFKIVTPPFTLYAPNTFTPDGNGMNDVFKFKGMGVKSFSMLIYNRWGELMYQSGDIDVGWDGTYKGKLVPSGVYIYRVEATSYKNVGYEKTGNVNVLR